MQTWKDADASRRLEAYVDSIGKRLGRKERREAFAIYVMGRLGDGERKSIEAIAATDVDFTAAREVWRCAKSGCGGTPTLVAACQHEPGEIAADANNVYWTNHGSLRNAYSDGAVMKLAK